jgi:adenylyltransferase/sulfurtransferase
MDLFRYRRQIIVPELGKTGQKILTKSHIGIIGCGGLGSNSADYLTRLGINQLTLIDNDHVDITNLHRTALYTEHDIGTPKTTALSTHLKKIDTNLKINTKNVRLIPKNAEEILTPCNLILDGTDNLTTRYLINEVSIKHQIPWVYAGVHTTTGMILAIHPHSTPCLSCLSHSFPQIPENEIPVLGTLPSIIAALQITEALKLLFHQQTAGFLILNIWTKQLDQLTIRKNLNCSICHHHHYEHLPR